MLFEGVGTVMPVWAIHRVDPRYLYIIENHEKYKIGKTVRTRDRFRAAKTWLPDMRLIAFKPFWGMSHLERLLHIGFANYSYAGEWYDFAGDDEARDLLIEGFIAFTDDSPDANSRDFIYWYNGEGMAEFLLAINSQKFSLSKFERQESSVRRTVSRTSRPV